MPYDGYFSKDGDQSANLNGNFLGTAWVKHGTWMNIRNRGEFALCAMGLHPAQMGQGGASLSL